MNIVEKLYKTLQAVIFTPTCSKQVDELNNTEFRA